MTAHHDVLNGEVSAGKWDRTNSLPGLYTLAIMLCPTLTVPLLPVCGSSNSSHSSSTTSNNMCGVL